MNQVELLNKTYKAFVNCRDRIAIIEFETDSEFISLLKELKKVIPTDLFKNKTVKLSKKMPERYVDKSYIAFFIDKLPQIVISKLGLIWG